MHKIKLIAGILLTTTLFIIAGCQGEPETTTVTSTTTAPAQTVTVSSTVTTTPQAQTETVTITETVTTTVSATTTPATTTTPTTTTPANGFTPVSSPDGKLLIVEAELIEATIISYRVTGEVLNLSDEVLSARITVEFLNNSGAVEQTGYVTVYDIEPDEQKTFAITSLDSFTPLVDFNIAVEVAP